MENKNKFYSTALASILLVLFLILAPSAVSASLVQKVEISGPVYNGSDIDDIIDTYGDGTTLTIDATQFAAFYYDIDKNLATETLFIKDVAGTAGNVIGEGGLVYRTTIQATNYGFEDWGMYPVIFLFTEKYIPLNFDKADKLTKLVLDSDDEYSIRTGEILDLGEGYAIEAKQVDVDGEKVWLEFTRNGEYVDDEIISVSSGLDNTWDVELDGIQGEYGVVVLKVHINQIFQDTAGRIAQIQGIWLIDYANAMTIDSNDEFGTLNDVSINGDALVIANEDTFTLTRNDTEEIAGGLAFKTADSRSSVLRFYVMKEITEPGTYEIRGQVASGTGDFAWDATNFAGFYYDFNDNVFTESLAVSGMSGNVIPEGGLVYSTTIKAVDYKYSNTAAGWGQYPVIGFFGEQYIPINPSRADKLARLVLDSDDKYTLGTGEILDLGQGYAIEVKQIDVNGENVLLEFTKDGEFVDDEIISIGTGISAEDTWDVELDGIQSENGVVVLRAHVNQVFQGEVDSIAQIEGLWLIDYANATTIESEDDFGSLNNVSILSDILTISNENTFTLARGNEVEIGQGMFFKIANTSTSELRYYPFVEKTIEENNSTLLPVADFSTNVTSGYAPLSVVFTDLSQNATSISWDVNNDGIEDSNSSSFVYEYGSAGTYTAKLIAINENGTDTETTTITVEKIPINDSVEVRGPVYSGSGIDYVIDTYGDGTTLTIDATQFSAFYYDIDGNVKTESLSIRDVSGTEGNVIGEGGVVYRTTIQATNYKFEEWGMYPIIGFFGEEYIPLNFDKADKFCKLVLDSDDKYTLGTGEILDLGEGYAIEVKQIDTSGEKVWLKFTRDGEYVDDEIVSVVDNGFNTWEVELDGIQGEDDVVVFRVHVNQIFQGAAGRIAQIQGIWLIDYANAMTIDSNDEFGKLNDVSINGDTLSITNEDTFTLTRNSDQEIARGLYFKVAETASNVLRFYVFKHITEPGTYEIRGQVVSGTGDFTWNATNFAGFYYDLNDDVATESLSVSGMSGNAIPEGGLVYSTIIEAVDYEYSNTAAGWDPYPVIGFFGEQYIPINPSRADKLAKLVLDSDDKYTLGTEEILDLGQGYAIEVKQIDVDNENVWLEFTKGGEFVDDEIISVGTGISANNTWDVELDGIQGENDVVVLKVHVNQVFQGENGNISKIEGLWLIDYANATAIESEDVFGALNNVFINGDTLTLSNGDIFTLARGYEVEIGQGMFFKIANTSTSELRYYPFVEKTIEENNSSVLPVAHFSTNVTSGYAPLSVLFTDLSQNATSRSWDVNNDGIEDSNEASFVYEYASAGTYTAKLTAINANGTDTETTTITVEKAPINDSFEVRGPVYNGSDIDNIIDTYGDGTTLTINATQFSAFYYDIDNKVANETLSIRDVTGTEGNVIGEGGIVYQTTIQKIPYEYENIAAGWDTYPVLGFFGEQYIPINSYKAEKFAKLILDSDDKHIVKTGETLDLGKGYAVKVKQIDIDSSKVWLEFTRDGELIDNEILSVISGSDNTWEVQLDGIQGENGVAVFRVHVNQVFRGEVDSIAQIEGLWLIDYANATVIEPDDEFGALNDVSLNGDTLTISNADTFTLTRNSDPEIASGLYFKVADTASNVLRFYVMKEITEPGTYEIRGQVVSGTDTFTWDATNFAGFYYDINDNVVTESLSVSYIDINMIPEGGLVYSTTIQNVDYEYSNAAAGWNQYPVIGFFGEQYIPINPTRGDKLARLILDSDDKYTIGTGEILDLGKGYAIEVKQIDVNDSKVWLEFTQDGEYVDDEILSVSSGLDNTWEVELDGIQGEDNVVVLKVHINQLFQDAAGRIAQIAGLWLIDYANATTIESDNEFGTLNDVSIYGDTIFITNEDTFTLTRGNEVEIGHGMYFKVADTPANELRYYPFVERVIGEHNSKILPVANFNSNVTSGNAPLAVQFTDTSQYATGWEWDFENDGTVDSSVQNPVHVYTAAGTYTVSLTASNVNGTASKTAKITVSEQSKPIVPVANFTANTTQGYAPLAVRFTDTSQYATGISWDFNNDGLADTSSGTVVYVYTASGQYKVNLTASNANGTNSKSMTITAYAPSQPVLPIANFKANTTQGYAPLAVQFTDSSQNAVSWSWDFDGDEISDSGLQNPAHVYKIPGIYTVNLSAGNQNGTASKTAVITVLEKEDENETNILPVANFSTNVTSGYVPLSVLFTDLSTNATSRSWDFGDGTNSIEQNTTHTYSEEGNYTVNLTVSNENGTDSKLATINVLEIPELVLPVANFSTNVTGGLAPLTVQFIDISQNATSISWDVNGDGIEDSNASSFVYEYTSKGIYAAKLTAKNANGTDEKTVEILVVMKTIPGPSWGNNGGGGGGGSPEPAKNVEVKELCQVFITNGKPIQFNFTKNATCVVYAGFDSRKTVGKTTAIAEQLKNKSTLTSSLSEGEVYKYFNVWVGNSGFASSDNIENRSICFKVEKSWLQNKNIDPDSITLNRYSNKTWEQLPVSQLKEDSKYLYFTADVSGYTFFAITGNEIAERTITEIQPESQIQDSEEKNGIIAADMEQEPEKEDNKSTPGFVIIYGVASLFVLYLYKRK